MALTWSDVTAMAPELADVPVAAQTEILATVADLPADVWASALTRGQLALARHLGTIQKRRGAAGQVVSKSVGAASVSYAALMNPSPLSSTVYGQEYERLVMTLSAARFGVA